MGKKVSRNCQSAVVRYKEIQLMSLVTCSLPKPFRSLDQFCYAGNAFYKISLKKKKNNHFLLQSETGRKQTPNEVLITPSGLFGRSRELLSRELPRKPN